MPGEQSSRFAELIMESRAAVERLHELWKLYMGWYTFAFTSNLLALSWAGLNPSFFSDIEQGPLRVPATVFAALWIFINLLNLFGSVMIDFYTGRASRRINRLLAHAYEGSDTPHDLRVQSNFPTAISRFAAQGNALSMIAFIIVWGYIFARARGFNPDAMIERLF